MVKPTRHVGPNPVEQQNVLRSVAGTKPPPATTAPNSAFSLAHAGDKGKRGRAPLLDPAQVAIHRALPMPAKASTLSNVPAYVALFDALQPGDAAELSRPHANGFMAWGKKAGKKLAKRVLPNGNVGVWREA